MTPYQHLVYLRRDKIVKTNSIEEANKLIEELKNG